MSAGQSTHAVNQSRVNAAHRCPLCAGMVRASLADRQNRVRCPSCLRVVVLEAVVAPKETEPESGPERGSNGESPVLLPKAGPPLVSATFQSPRSKPKENAAQRIVNLEQRVAALEDALAEMRGTAPSTSSRLKWMAQAVEPDLSPARAAALSHNLSTIMAHRITIQFPPGNEVARERAHWFKTIFERAHWAVEGPEDAPERDVHRGFFMATAVPVPPQAAATFMALRAAGFALDAAFDPQAETDEERLVVA
jgi:hypothetical protein